MFCKRVINAACRLSKRSAKEAPPPKKHVLSDKRIDVVPDRGCAPTRHRRLRRRLRAFRRQVSPKRLPSPPTRSTLHLRDLRRWLSFSFPISPIASSSPTAPARIIKLKLRLEPSRVFLVFRTHVRPMHLYLMRLEIKLRIEHDKFLRLTDSVRTREMRLRKVELLGRASSDRNAREGRPRQGEINLQGSRSFESYVGRRARHQHGGTRRTTRHVLLISNLVSFA